ncbi:Mu transposase C-terminal domain-containing protein [Streptomyces sp. NPDC005151]
MDRGKDFLSRTVTAAFNALDVKVEDLPAYTPHLKGTVEGLNRAVESMFLAALPGYVRQPRPGRRRARPKDEVLLGFEDFTARLLDWVSWWNTSHHPGPLKGRSPLEVWEADPTPLREISADELWTFTLEDDGRARVISTRGVRFRRGDYAGAWMTGQAGTQVRVRFMPHHDHRIEVFDAATGRYLGPATLADQASPEQISAVRTARAARSRRLRKDLAAARQERYGAQDRLGPARAGEGTHRAGSGPGSGRGESGGSVAAGIAGPDPAGCSTARVADPAVPCRPHPPRPSTKPARHGQCIHRPARPLTGEHER